MLKSNYVYPIDFIATFTGTPIPLAINMFRNMESLYWASTQFALLMAESHKCLYHTVMLWILPQIWELFFNNPE